MSAEKRDGKGYAAAGQPPRLTLSEYQEIGQFFKQLIDSPLRWAIIAAGVGAIVEGLHVFWLAVRYLGHF
jgi:hypothetical protein